MIKDGGIGPTAQNVYFDSPNRKAARYYGALTNVTLPYVRALADKGWRQAWNRSPPGAGVTVACGAVVHGAAAEAGGLPFRPLEKVG
ncbi:MAG: hypothetical protein ACM3XS_09625 [Bacteroidota bacterium]